MYNLKSATDAYTREKILTASPVELIIILYDGVIKQMKIADICIEEHDYEKANKAILKAQDIICELVKNLDLNYELSDQLLAIYDFVNNSLIQINLKKNREDIIPLLEIMSSLKESWVVVKQKHSETYTEEAKDDLS